MIEYEKIIDLSNYLAIIEELSRSYPSTGFLDNPTTTKFLFRGLDDVGFKLHPSLLRGTISQVNGSFLGYEKIMLQAFMVEAAQQIPGLGPDDWLRWAEYAQHFGIPTRLLDWTSNPLVALYFACSGNQRDSDGAIWILHATNYMKYTRSEVEKSNNVTMKSLTPRDLFKALINSEMTAALPIYFKPFYIDPRMSVQSSYFMMWGSDHRPFEEIIPYENYAMEATNRDVNGTRTIGTSQSSSFIFKLEVPKNRKLRLLRQLDSAGVNSMSLFPGLDGMGRHIAWKYRFDWSEIYTR